MSKRRGLGRGLNELLAWASQAREQDEVAVIEPVLPKTPALQARELAIEQISPGPFQPRQHIETESLAALAESIEMHGVIQPILVRETTKGQYEIIAGERRWRASQLAGKSSIPAIVKSVSDEAATAIALIENIQRQALNPIEEAQALDRLSREFGLSHEEVAKAVGRSRSGITNHLRLLTLNADVKEMLVNGELEMGHAKVLLGLKGSLQSQMARTVAMRQLSVRQTEELIHNRAKFDHQVLTSAKKKQDPNIHQLQLELAEKLGAHVRIIHQAKGNKGKLIIKYNSLDELDGILAHFR